MSQTDPQIGINIGVKRANATQWPAFSAGVWLLNLAFTFPNTSSRHVFFLPLDYGTQPNNQINFLKSGPIHSARQISVHEC